MKTGLIYKATNKINGKSYIGQTCYKLSWRVSDHFSKSRRKSDCVFHKAIRKYGKDNFSWDIIHDNIPENKLNDLENHYIKEHNSYCKNNGYNMTFGGEGTRGFYFKHKERTKVKIRNALTGQKLSENRKRRISNSHKGKVISKETREKISNSMIGNSRNSKLFLIYNFETENEELVKNLQEWIRNNPKHNYSNIKSVMNGKYKHHKNKWFKRIYDLNCLYEEGKNV